MLQNHEDEPPTWSIYAGDVTIWTRNQGLLEVLNVSFYTVLFAEVRNISAGVDVRRAGLRIAVQGARKTYAKTRPSPRGERLSGSDYQRQILQKPVSGETPPHVL